MAAAAGDAPAPPASPDDVNRLIRTLQDPAARADLVKELQALLAAQKQAAPEAPLGDELGQELLRGLSDALAGASELLGDAIEGLGNPAHILHWLEHKIDDPEWRAAWKDALLKLAIVLGGGVVAGALAGWLVARPMRSLAKRTPARPWQRIGPLFARSLLDLAPTLAFAAVAYGALVGTAPHEPARLAALAIINAALIAKLVLTVARFLISPYAPALRLVPLLDETAAYLDIWLHRLVLIAVYGFLALQAGAALGMPHGVHLALFNLFGLLLTLLLIAFVLQNRQAIARGLRGRPAEPDEVPDPFHRLRHHAGNYWHIFAVVYLVAIYLVWALRVKDGFVYVLRGSVTTLLILLVAALLIRLGRRAWDKMLEVNG
ncbi:MAG TPA: hypothetical protein VMU42_08630, partial [Candidatus Sulfotelmatobacter sp.]|nr:hypothetical protein [Candidatus Sulfotelmatobacter sp.]